MSEYSSLLRNYIVEKERANVAKMAVYCGIPIKQVYLYMNGKALPKTRGIAEQMSDYMHLTPIQKKQMMRAYDKAVIGSERYELYETINACMLQFPYGEKYFKNVDVTWDWEASVYKGYKRDKIEMRGDRAEMSDFPLYLNTVAGGLDCRNQAIGGFSFVVKIYALPVVEIIGQFLYLLGRYGFDTQIGYCF